MNNAQATITEIRANMGTYSDEDISILRGRLTLNMYGAEVSEALAAEVIAECARRKQATEETETMNNAPTNTNNMEAHNMTNNEDNAKLYTASLLAAADPAYWEAVLADEGLAVVADVTPESAPLPRDRSQAMAAMHEAAGYDVTPYVSAQGRQKQNATTTEPTDDMANSMGDPELLGLYVASPSASAKAKRERATTDIEALVLSKDNSECIGTARVRRPRKSAAEKAAAIRARRAGNRVAVEVAAEPTMATPRCDYFKREQGLPCAHTATTGPLSIVDMPAPQKLSVQADATWTCKEHNVDCIGYESGRSPFQLSAFTASNSDITG